MFPTSSVPFPTYYDGVMRADLGVLTRSNRLGKHEAKQKNPPKKLGRYMQIFTWLVLMV